MTPFSDNITVLENLSLVAASISQYVLIVDANDKIEWVNNAFEEKLGFSLNEAIGCKISELLAGPETDFKVVSQIDKAVFEEGEPIQAELIQYRKDKSTFWSQIYVTPVIDKGELVKYIVVGNDITEKRMTNEKLKETELIFNQIATTINDVFFLYNIEESKYDFISPNCKKVMGADQDFFYSGGSYNSSFGVQEDQGILQKAFEQINQGEPYEIDYRIEVDGKIRWIRENSFPIYTAEGILVKNSGVCKDITEMKMSEISLLKTHENSKILSELGLKIASEVQVENIVDIVYDKIIYLMDSDCFGIGLFNADKNTLDFPFFIEADSRYDNHQMSLSDKNKLAVICYEQEKEIIIHDSEKELSKYIEDLGPILGDATHSIIYMPLKYDGSAIGVITVQSFKKFAYDDYSLSLLKNLSVFLSVGLQKALLYSKMEEEIEQRTREVRAQNDQLEETNKRTRLVSDIGYAITSSLDFEDIFMILFDNVSKLMKVDFFGIQIINSYLQVVECRHQIVQGKRMAPYTIPFDSESSFSVWSMKNKASIFMGDIDRQYKDYRGLGLSDDYSEFNACIVIPLIVDDNVIGVLSVGAKELESYTESEFEILQSLSFYTASAIDKATVYDTLEQKVLDRTSELQDKNKNIVDSINYAKKIQDNILPSMADFKKVFPDSFVMYRPKDIISGDFFLIDTIMTNSGLSLKAFVVGDCTGHGVPGGILSVLCSTLLKQTFKNRDINSPGEALDAVSEELKKLLESDDILQMRDGMDVAFGVINSKTNQLYFAGANNSCVVIRNGELIQVKGDRQHVGYSEDKLSFTTQIASIQTGDVIYVGTDGYADQFGGPRKKKFMQKRYHEFLLKIHQEEMVKQNELLAENFDDWKGNVEQTDDVCLIGIRVNLD